MVRFPTVFAGLLILSLPLQAEEIPSTAPTLITKSPFLPPGFQPPGQPGQAPPLPPAAQSTTYEFRGVYQLEDVYYFNIYDPKEMKGVWLTSADPDQGSIEIIDFDSEGDELIVRIDGETQNLALVKTSDTPMPVARATGPRQQIRPTSGPAQGPADRRRVIRPLERQTSTDSPEAPRRRVIRPNPQS